MHKPRVDAEISLSLSSVCVC